MLRALAECVTYRWHQKRQRQVFAKKQILVYCQNFAFVITTFDP